MTDFGVSKALPNLSPSDVQRVVKFIREDMGASDESYLSEIEESDFTKDKILPKVQARRLIKFWKTGAVPSGGASGGSGISQSVGGNVGTMMAAGRDVNKTEYSPQTMNKIDKVENMQTGGERKNMTTNISGEVKGHNMHFGFGNVNSNQQ